MGIKRCERPMRLLTRIQALLVPGRRDEELDVEIRAHLELLARDYERRGMNPIDARFTARRDFGGVEQMKEAYRDRRALRWVDDLLRDVRLALRSLRRNRAFSTVAVLTIGLGVGGPTAVFSVMNPLLFYQLAGRSAV